MIEFKREISQLLPYRREDYISYFDEENTFNSDVIWYAVSLQLAEIRDEKLYQVPEKTVNFEIERLENSFKELVLKFGNEGFWIINHDDKDLPWFKEGDKGVPKIRSLFKENEVPISFIGGLIFHKEDLIGFARELIMYPYVLSYKNLDLSHNTLPFIIKLTGHLTLDLLSTDKSLLDEMMNDDTFDSFLKIKYRSR